eukprot:m.112251 g.112251  ORF g.112251 m.112251 type:complete len:336 (-) comp14366_c5_seq8:227-1234(-)
MFRDHRNFRRSHVAKCRGKLHEAEFSPTIFLKFLFCSLLVATTSVEAYTQAQCQSMGYSRAATGTYSMSCACGSLWFTIGSTGPSCVSRTTNGCVSWTGDCSTYDCSASNQCYYSYSGWTCSSSCGSGTLRRTRSCPNSCNPTATEYGSGCLGGSPSSWGGWSQWSSCGQCGGSSSRSRTCTPNCYTGSCTPYSADYAYRSCTQTGASASWSSWYLYSSCNAPLCGSGTYTIYRTCDGQCSGSCSLGAMSTQSYSCSGGDGGKFCSWSMCESDHIRADTAAERNRCQQERRTAAPTLRVSTCAPADSTHFCAQRQEASKPFSLSSRGHVLCERRK